MISTSRSFAGLPSSRKRNFAVSRAYRSLGCCVGHELDAGSAHRLHFRRCADTHESLHAPLRLLDLELGRIRGNSGRHFRGGAAPAFRLAVFFPARHYGFIGDGDAIRASLTQLQIEAAARAALGRRSAEPRAVHRGRDTTSVSIGIAPWFTENRSSAMAASTATQPPERASTVCDGSNQGLAAGSLAGTSSANSASK